MSIDNTTEYQVVRRNVSSVNACVMCRRRKKKCSEGRPACASCIKLGRTYDCRYDPPRLSKKLWHEDSEANQSTESEQPSAENKGQRSSGMLILSPEVVDRGISVLTNQKDWWNLDVIPAGMSELLLNIFVEHAPQIHFDVQIPSLLARLSNYPPSHPSYPHTSLLNAIYLITTSFVSSLSHPAHSYYGLSADWDTIKHAFLRRTRKGLRENLAMAENLFDFLLASSMSARFHYYSMRLLEGRHENSGALQLAVACNLHTIPCLTSPEDLPQTLLPNPTSATDVRDRVNAFWTAFLGDRINSIMMGLPTSIADDKITTSIPPKEKDYTGPLDTVTSLFLEDTASTDTKNDTTHGMKVKGVALMAKVRALVQESGDLPIKDLRYASPAFVQSFHTTDKSLTRLLLSLPTSPPTSGVSTLNTSDVALADFAAVHTLMRASVMQLHSPFSASCSDSYSKMVKAAKEIIEIARELAVTCEAYWHLVVEIGWDNSIEVLHKEVIRVATDGNKSLPERILIVKKLKSDMEFMGIMLRRLMKVYPGFRPTLKVSDEIIAKDTAIIQDLEDNQMFKKSSSSRRGSIDGGEGNVRGLRWVQLNPSMMKE